MKNKLLYFNGRILTQADRLVVDSMAVDKGRIVAIGNRLEHDPDFGSYTRCNLRGRTVTPGFVDAHTHFHLLARQRAEVKLDGLDTLDKCLRRIKRFAATLPRNAWVVGSGLFPDGFKSRVIPDRYQLDRVTGGRPAFIFFKDTHSAWVNSRALEAVNYSAATPPPERGRIEKLADGTPSGILREPDAYRDIFLCIPPLSQRRMNECYQATLGDAYRRGVTGVHSFDGPDGFEFFSSLAEKNRVGLRINYYPTVDLLPKLEKTGTTYGTGTEFFRLAGLKMFADGALGSQTAFCFNRYAGSRDNRGLEVMTIPEMKRSAKRAARLGLPSAIHAIGDRAVANVITTLEAVASSGLRHRIEHVQLLRRKDLARLKKLGVVASMQPSHCPSDIDMVRRYWGARGRNAYMFKTILNNRIRLAFGSDAPIEPLHPLDGIAAAVRRAHEGSRDVFYPEQRLSAVEALHAFTAGPAWASGQERCRGYLLPGYPADFVVLDRDITRIAPAAIYDTRVLATVLDGTIRYCSRSLKW